MATHVMRAMVIVIVICIVITIMLLIVLNTMTSDHDHQCDHHRRWAAEEEVCDAYSATGTRARVARVRAEYPDQLDHS